MVKQLYGYDLLHYITRKKYQHCHTAKAIKGIWRWRTSNWWWSWFSSSFWFMECVVNTVCMAYSSTHTAFKLLHAITLRIMSFPQLAVSSGNYVALQYSKNAWLSCHHNTCTRQTCPGFHFTRSERARCAGEVFRIYKSTPGRIKVGNKVGFYFPKKGNWFSCWDSDCDTKPCPGVPNWLNGFANPHRWQVCNGEIFQIYAEGRNFGDDILHSDAIMLCYPYQRQWVSLHESRHSAHKQTCPGGVLPPPLAKWQVCNGEVFFIKKIWLLHNWTFSARIA